MRAGQVAGFSITGARRALVAVAIGALAAFGAAAGEVPADVQQVVRWVQQSRDNHGLPFAVVDKRDASIHVYAADGRAIGATPVLLGLARGDHSVPGIGDMKVADIPPADRTTPAGRFDSEPGRNLDGEEIVWLDYDAALAIHRLRPSPARERRAQRLTSSEADEHRISYGCVVVPVAFYEQVVAPLLGRGRGVVYVLPETRALREMFPVDAG
jgi:hypothetical protein